ncbi:MAG: EAL domain-containing protein, partial [Sporichthyaceae bacterium]|nr:EAL domain-containing protein [Sporichthyaceae bacterium]
MAVLAAFLPPEPVGRWLPVIAGVLAVLAMAEGSLAQLRSDGLRGGLVREPLVLIGAGLCLTVAGEALQVSGLSSEAYADGVSLAAYPFVIAGLVRMTRGRLKEGALDTLLVAAIAPAALCAFLWLPLVEAVGRWTAQAGNTSWQIPLFLSVDALAVAIIARLAVTFRGRPIAYQFLLGASTFMMGAHISRSVSEVTQVVPASLGSQTLLVVAFGLFGAAALHPSIRRGRGVRTRVVTVGRFHVALLMVAVIVGPAFAVLRYGDRGTWVVLVAVGPALVSLLVVAHLSRMIAERQRLEFASHHDALTGLANRGRFYERLGSALEWSATRRREVAVMFIDLDRFKNVNDTHGHDAGDELLREVARRLRDSVRDDDLVARLAGDEFAVLLVNGSTDDVSDVCHRLLTAFANPFQVAGQSLAMTLSIGTAVAPQHGDDADTLLRHADSAMYVAKASGRNNAQIYREGMQTHAHQRMVVEARLREAIDNKELALHYQPKLDSVTGRVIGVEALVRWSHPEHGLIPPGAFIHSAEESGLVAPLGAWVLHTACHQAQYWRRVGYGDLSVSVNVSAKQFELQDVPTLVASALTESGLPAELLELELTESLRLDDDDRNNAHALHALESLGVRCSIDDFGTGYSNLSYLHAYPIDAVKLDRSFVHTVTGPDTDSPLVRGVIALAHSLGLKVIAEGVETQDQLDFLQLHLCDEWQGFLASPGLPADEVTTLLRQGGIAGTVAWPFLGEAELSKDAVWDEKTLREVLWRELGVTGLQRRSDADDESDNRHRGVVLTGASGVMALPVFLGLGSAGALPPGLQGRLTDTLSAIGAVAPHDPMLRVGDLFAGKVQSGAGTLTAALGAGDHLVSGFGSEHPLTPVITTQGGANSRSDRAQEADRGAINTGGADVGLPAVGTAGPGHDAPSGSDGSGGSGSSDHSNRGSDGAGLPASTSDPDRSTGTGSRTDVGSGSGSGGNGGNGRGNVTDSGSGPGTGPGSDTGAPTDDGNGSGGGQSIDPGSGSGSGGGGGQSTDPGSGGANGGGQPTDPGNEGGGGGNEGGQPTDPGN